MDYKTILVYLDDPSGLPERIAFAAQLANIEGAHLVGITQVGLYPQFYRSAHPGIDLAAVAPLFSQREQEARQRAAQFDALARQAGVVSFEHRIGDEEPGNALAVQAMYADLVIVGQSGPGAGGKQADTAIHEYVAMHSPCPVLALPHDGSYSPAFERVLVGWNASPEAARAVRQALPFLKRAKEVEVAIFDGAHRHHGHGATGAREIGPFLAHHGVTVHVSEQEADGDVGDALLALASERRSELLVLGCYGRSRFREILLGGVSLTVLRRLPLPTLLTH